MSNALATLPWVESDSIRPSREKRQVRFTIRDRSQFDFEAVKTVLGKEGYGGARLLTGPTDS